MRVPRARISSMRLLDSLEAILRDHPRLLGPFHEKTVTTLGKSAKICTTVLNKKCALKKVLGHYGSVVGNFAKYAHVGKFARAFIFRSVGVSINKIFPGIP